MAETVNTNLFDQSSTYNTMIAPLLNKIKTICVVNKIPFYACFAIENNDKETVYRSEAQAPVSMGIKLNDDAIIKGLLTLNGWELKMPYETNFDDESVQAFINKSSEDFEGELSEEDTSDMSDDIDMVDSLDKVDTLDLADDQNVSVEPVKKTKPARKKARKKSGEKGDSQVSDEGTMETFVNDTIYPEATEEIEFN